MTIDFRSPSLIRKAGIFALKKLGPVGTGLSFLIGYGQGNNKFSKRVGKKKWMITKKAKS